MPYLCSCSHNALTAGVWAAIQQDTVCFPMLRPSARTRGIAPCHEGSKGRGAMDCQTKGQRRGWSPVHTQVQRQSNSFVLTRSPLLLLFCLFWCLVVCSLACRCLYRVEEFLSQTQHRTLKSRPTRISWRMAQSYSHFWYCCMCISV